eukprot:6466782-Amphidinium_carterae.4
MECIYCALQGPRLLWLRLRVQLRRNFMNSHHLQSVIMELGIIKSVEEIKLHLHPDSASGKAMVGKLGMSKKSK